MTKPKMEDAFEHVETETSTEITLGRIVWDEDVGAAVVEWDGDEMPLMSDDYYDQSFVKAVLDGVQTDVGIAQVFLSAAIGDGFDGTYH